METKIVTQDVYLPVEGKTEYLQDNIDTLVKIGALKKSTDLIVLTLAELNEIRKKDIEDAWEAGRTYQQAAHSEYYGGHENEKPTKTEYLNQIFK